MAYQDINMVISTGQSYVPGQFIQVIHDLSNYMFGQVVYYNTITGDLTFTPTAVSGSGNNYTDWRVVPSGSTGAATLYQGTSQTVIPVPSTTTTTTVYVPPTPSYFYYNVVAYTCPYCVPQAAYIVARSSTSRITDFYYNIGDGYVYKVITEISYTTYDIDLDGSAAGSTCSGACSI